MSDTPYLLFHGGNYKRGIDDWRIRVPLNEKEIDEVFYDPDVPNDTDNSIASEFNMAEFEELFCNLVVGDELYLVLLPDACIYRGLWAMAFNPVKGFTARFDCVRARDLYNAWVGGQSMKGLPAVAGTASLDYDFSDGLGFDSWTAETNAKTPWDVGDYNYYRNNAALKWAGFDTQFFAALGEAMYIRMTITAVGEAGTSDPGVCCTCGKPKFPVFQIGAIYDRMCADKQRHVKYCNCHEIPCRNGCNQAQSQEGKTYAIVRVEYKDEFNDNIYPAGMVRVNDGETVTIEPVKLSGYTEPASVQVKFENGKLTDAQNEGVGTVKFKYIKE